MTNTNKTRPALILNELTLAHANASVLVDYSRRIGAEWLIDGDLDEMCKRFEYVSHWARVRYGARALPVLNAMGVALDSGRGLGETR